MPVAEWYINKIYILSLKNILNCVLTAQIRVVYIGKIAIRISTPKMRNACVGFTAKTWGIHVKFTDSHCINLHLRFLLQNPRRKLDDTATQSFGLELRNVNKNLHNSWYFGAVKLNLSCWVLANHLIRSNKLTLKLKVLDTLIYYLFYSNIYILGWGWKCSFKTFWGFQPQIFLLLVLLFSRVAQTNRKKALLHCAIFSATCLAMPLRDTKLLKNCTS